MDAHVPHVAPNHMGVYVCRDCASPFNNNSDYIVHYINEHAQASGTVPAASTKGSQVVTVVQPTVEEHYTGEAQEWTDWLGEFEDAVKRGLCDEILKDMARLIFNRRDVMQGKDEGTSFRNFTPIPKNGLANGAAPNVAAPGKGGTAQFDPQGTFVGKVQAVAKGTRGSVEVNGRYYLRKEIVGLTIRVPMTLNPIYVRGLRVKVEGVGEKRAKVKWVDLPKEGSKWRADADAGKPCFLPLSSLTDILG